MKDKKYYWIKLRTDFFNREEIDFLLSQENGCKYIVLYEMLCLSTANNNGQMGSMVGEIFIPYDVKKIIRDTKYFDFDTVTVALEIFKKLGLIYKEENNILKIANFDEMVGSEVSSAKRVREYRARQKALQCNKDVTQDIDNKILDIRERDIDKNKTYCHLNFKEKQESCNKCLKRNICNVPDKPLSNSKKVPIFYKDENGVEYWYGKKCEFNNDCLDEQEQLEFEQRLKELK